MKTMMNNAAPIDLDTMLELQKNAWNSGRRPKIDDFLSDSSIASNPDILLDLIYNEIVVREEMGDHPSIAEYVARYPNLEEDLKLHFEVHQAFNDHLLTETQRVSATEPLVEFDPVALVTGQKLSDYEIISELGRGGMGVVYKARHNRLKRFVALKMFQPGRNPTSRELSRFRSEAEMVARSQHPNIVQIFDIGEQHGLPYLALELVTGGTLQDKLNDLPYQPREAAILIEKLSVAVQHAHDQQIIHRDLKPANILFTADGIPKVTDFGLAKLLESDQDTTHDVSRTGVPIGTPRYMSPEQAIGKHDHVSPATDVYALGTLLYESMTGQAPFVSASIVETLDKIRHDEPVSPRRLQKNIAKDLETICLKCLRKDPVQRYVSALALSDDLRRYLNGEPILARRTPWWGKLGRWCRRHPTVTTTSFMFLLTLILGCIFLINRESAERDRIDSIRQEVNSLIIEGQKSVMNGDGQRAKSKFLDALSKVQGERSLSDFELGIRGWLDQSERIAFDQIGKIRKSVPSFEERRDDAFALALLNDLSNQESMDLVNEVINGTLEFAQINSPEWLVERELLVILQAEIALVTKKFSAGLEKLNQIKSPRIRHYFELQAALHEQLNQEQLAKAARANRDQIPPLALYDLLFRGVRYMLNKQVDLATHDFDQILLHEPNNRLARFLLGICCLKNNRANEAIIAFTACISERPRSGRCHLYRSQGYLQNGQLVQAIQDLQFVSEMSPNAQLKKELSSALDQFRKLLNSLMKEEQEVIWNSTIVSSLGQQRLKEILLLQPQK